MRYKPMLAGQYDAATMSGEAIVQAKKDGWRVTWQDGQLLTRNGGRVTNPPAILQALRDYFPEMVLDGELCGLSFRNIASTAATSGRVIENAAATFQVFDILEVGSQNVTGLPLASRLAILQAVFQASRQPEGGPVRLLEWVPATDPLAQAAEFKKAGDEGAIVKYLSAPYLPGLRPKRVWEKVKFVNEFDAVVTGATEGRNGFTGTLGALCVRSEHPVHGTLEFRVGGGMTMAERGDFWRRHQAGALAGIRVTVLTQDDNAKIPSRFGRFVREVRERRDLQCRNGGNPVRP